MKSTLFFSTLAIVLTALVLGVGYFLIKPSFEPTNSAPSQATSTSSQEPATTREVPAGFKEFRSDSLHFSLLYPENLTLKQQNGQGNTTTLIFQDTAAVQGFQIYITPYQQAQVSEAQFKKDIPSGIRNDLKNISIEGVPGASFYSTDSALGETYEVWFVRQGWLYEVTTLKPLDTWLSAILQNWKFI